MVKVLPKESLSVFLAELSRSYAVFAPVKRDELTRFDRYSAGDHPTLDYSTTNMPPKSLFLPHGECLVSFGGAGPSVPAADEKFVIFMNEIDAEAISILDEIFGGKFQDNYYRRMRENSVIVAVKNGVRMRNSFSDELGLKFRDGFDVLLSDVGDRYVAEARTAKGRKLLKSKFIVNGRASSKAASKTKAKKFDLKKISAFLDKGPEQKIWHELEKECFACGICAYVCPICYCFDVEDASRLDGGGCRTRYWDSCMLADFALVAGGANFRGKRHERIHNWYHHKFARAVAERGRPDCVGCGRCITFCPAKIKIHDRILECRK